MEKGCPHIRSQGLKQSQSPYFHSPTFVADFHSPILTTTTDVLFGRDWEVVLLIFTMQWWREFG